MTEFAKNGYEGTSLRTVAAGAGVDMALVARLFGSKAELWSAVVDRMAARHASDLEKLRLLAELVHADPTGACVQLIELMAEVSFEIPAFPALLMLESVNDGDRLQHLLNTLVRPFRDACKPIIKSANDASVLRVLDVNLFFGMLIAAISFPMVAPSVFAERPTLTPTLRDIISRQACAMVLEA